MSLSPMMKQYQDAKALCGDALLLFRMGDFYELFYEDAKIAAKTLGLTLTSRDKNTNPIPMAGFPHHQLDGYLAKLIQGGHRAAVCEQVEDPKKAKGLVKREVTRVVTPGTLTDEALLDPKQNNYLAAVSAAQRGAQPGEVGLAWVDLSTGRFFAATVPGQQVCDHLARLSPAEVLISETETWLKEALDTTYTLTVRPAWVFAEMSCRKTLTQHFGTATLEGFGFFAEDGQAIIAAGAIVDYLNETQKTTLTHIDQLIPSRTASLMEIDQSTRRSLELSQTMRTGDRTGSLLGVIDRTVTPMGSRLLADWLTGPLTDQTAIEGRLDAIAELLAEYELLEFLKQELRDVYDLQRLLARASTGRASPRDLQYVGRTLAKLPKLKAKLVGRKAALLEQLEQRLDLCEELHSQLNQALADECPLSSRDGGIIREGFHGRLDELRDLATGG
ncbi:MAG: DNA mismatch repair protein MutS, partial [Planctomycetota bacterium]